MWPVTPASPAHAALALRDWPPHIHGERRTPTPTLRAKFMNNDVDLADIRRRVELIGRLSDGLVTIGPFGIGLDGVLNWIPGLGEIYSAGAAAYLLAQGYRAGVPAPTLLLAAALMGGRTVITAIPLAGPVVADIFTMHKWSARLIVAAIDKRLAAQAEGRPAAASPSPMARAPLWRTRRNRAAIA